MSNRLLSSASIQQIHQSLSAKAVARSYALEWIVIIIAIHVGISLYRLNELRSSLSTEARLIGGSAVW